MTRAIYVHPEFERVWPLVADQFHRCWPNAAFERLDYDDRPLSDVADEPGSITQLVSLGVPVSDVCPDAFPALSEAAVFTGGYGLNEDVADAFESRGVTLHYHDSEGFWGQSVAECALGLTIGALRRIPQLHACIQTDQSPWDYDPEGDPGPGKRGHQFGDDDRFTCGTVAGKRVRVAGVGNIGSRYASITDSLGAEVGAYDPYADEPCFHRSGARRVRSLATLVSDAEVFAPLVPPTPETVGLVDESLVNALPGGCLVVLATRARVIDTDALRERVLADELALAADVWDENPGEPLPLDDPLLGRDNVVHTPHIAGRTRHANEEWAERLARKFGPVSSEDA